MGGLYIPKHVAARVARSGKSGNVTPITGTPINSKSVEPLSLADEIAAPIPAGLPVALFWRVHVIAIGMRTASKGNIQLTEKMIDDQNWTHGLGKIVGMGPLAYKGAAFADCNPDDLPKLGDLVLFNPKSPARVMKDGRVILILNDDHINAKVAPEHAEGFVFLEGLST